jgi:hypothetical protein
MIEEMRLQFCGGDLMALNNQRCFLGRVQGAYLDFYKLLDSIDDEEMIVPAW